MMVELRGIEVVLRPLSIDDAEALAATAAESHEPYRFNPVPNGLEEAQHAIKQTLRQRDAGQRCPCTIVWRHRVVGTTSYWDVHPWQWPVGCPMQRTDRPDAVEVGSTWLAASAQRTRCNTEAKYFLLAHAFEGWEVHRVSLRTDERSEQSRRAIERLGARFEGIRRADMPGQDGTVRHSAFYSIVRAAWPEVRDRLQGLLSR